MLYRMIQGFYHFLIFDQVMARSVKICGFLTLLAITLLLLEIIVSSIYHSKEEPLFCRMIPNSFKNLYSSKSYGKSKLPHR